MKAETLVRMANEIAAYFRPYPAEAAAAGLRDHMQAFWTPKMRAAMHQHVSVGGAGLEAGAKAALQGWDGGCSPVARATAPAQASGQGASDAG